MLLHPRLGKAGFIPAGRVAWRLVQPGTSSYGILSFTGRHCALAGIRLESWHYALSSAVKASRYQTKMLAHAGKSHLVEAVAFCQGPEVRSQARYGEAKITYNKGTCPLSLLPVFRVAIHRSRSGNMCYIPSFSQFVSDTRDVALKYANAV